MSAAAEWFARQSFHVSDAPARNASPAPAQSARIVAEEREREAHVHVWLAHLCRVEAAKLAGLTVGRAARIPTDDEMEQAAATLSAAYDLDEHAARIAGCTTERERLELIDRAMRRFHQPEPTEVSV